MIKVIGLVLVLVVALASVADAFVMCGRKNRNGLLVEGTAIRIRSQCKRSELQLDPSDLDLPIAAGARHAVIKDSRGTILGPVTHAPGGDGHVSIAIKLDNGSSGWLDVERDGTLSGAESNIYFESVDCSGTPLIYISGADPGSLAFGYISTSQLPSDGTIYYGEDAGTLRMILSARNLSSGFCSVVNFTALMTPARTTTFYPPYAMVVVD